MGSLAPAEAEALLAGPAGRIAAITLAAGPEDFLRDRLVAAFRAGAAREGAEFLRLEGDDLAAETLAEALAMITLFGDARRIWIREGARLERGAEEALLAWAAGSGEGVRVLVTTSREVSELKSLQSLASAATTVACSVGGTEAGRWAARLAEQAGLKLPSTALSALVLGAANLLALSQEIDKLRLHAGPDGRVAPAAMDVLAGTRGGASAERWAMAVLARDARAARAEGAVLDAEGVAGTSCLWAVAERALAALDPQPYGYGRRVAGTPLRPAAARRALDAVYRADRALKRGEVRDAELRDYVERDLVGIQRG